MSFKHMKFFSRFVGLLLLLILSGSYLMPALAPVPAAVQDTQVLYQERAARLTSEQAIAVALNDLEVTADGYRLSHPRHTASFTAQGVTFTPKRGGPAWSWQLAAVSAGDRSLAGARLGAVDPSSTGTSAVVYERDALVEQYLAHGNSVEQQFVIPQLLGLDGADLVIEGVVQSAGRFEEAEDGWSWRAGTGAVHLGDVRVFDAAGEDLPATMQVTASATRIVVDGPALARAAYPVTIDPEIGTNDMRLSDMGSDLDYSAGAPAVAYNSTNNEYLVVWGGETNTSPLVNDEYEIFGQRVDAATGAEIGEDDFRLSDMGPDGNTDYYARSPDVAYNSVQNEYLVVWTGYDGTPPMVNNHEIYGQRLNGASGAEIGDDVRLSDMGAETTTDVYRAYSPAVAYNSTSDEYLVVWYGDDNAGALVDDEYEIYGQILNGASGAKVGDDFRLSDMGPDGDVAYAAKDPAVAYNSTSDEYLVVWWGDDNGGVLVDEEYEIFGHRVNAASGTEIGDDVRLSDMGPDGDADYDALYPAVAYNSTDNEYLVVWCGDDDAGGLVDEELEIFGQRVAGATGAEVGENDVRLSDMGPDGDAAYIAAIPTVAYNSADNEYLVVWAGDDDAGDLVDDEGEIFGQRVAGATGAEVGENDVRLSDMGPDGDPDYLVSDPAVAYNSAASGYLVVWSGEDDAGGVVDDGAEIYSQRVDGPTGAEAGENDVRLSVMGHDLAYDALYPAVAYNSTDNEYLVVWQGDDNAGDLVDNEYEIYGQRVDAASGEEIGGDFCLSDMGPDGDADYYAFYPAVAYNSTNNEYLVVWEGRDGGPSQLTSYEIYGQLLEGVTGAEIGDDFRLSDMGPAVSTDYEAHAPDVTYNSTDNEYLVVWAGDDDTGALVNDEYEIYGQRVDGVSGDEIDDDLLLSSMGPDGDVAYAAKDPAAAYNSAQNEYLIVWWGDDNTAPLVNDELEVFGQRLRANGTELGDDFRLSDMGPDGDTSYAAGIPDVAYNSTDNEYLVVWAGDNDELPTAGKREIFGQRLDGVTGGELGTNDFRLSDMGPAEDVDYGAYTPAVAYNSANNEYLVVWSGDDDAGELFDEEFEIYGQRVDADGSEIDGDVRLSDMGPDGSELYWALYPAVACDSTDGELLAVWSGMDDRVGMVKREYEIFGQRFAVVSDDPITGLSATNDGPTLLGNATILSATITAGSNVSYTWAFGDNGSGVGAVISHTYATAGVYTAVVTASNSISISTATTTVTVTEESDYVVYLPLVVKNE